MSKILTNRDGNIRLELRDDRLSAWLTIRRSGRLTDEHDILALIDEAGIKTGFDEAGKYMRKHGLEKDFDSPFPIAMCNRVKGETKLNYFFDLELAKHFDGRVRTQDLEKLTCIEAGTVIADYSSNIFERQGSIYDIYGEMLQDEEFDLEAARQVAGENVSFSLDKRQFVAGRSGFVSVGEDGRISVMEKLFLAGSIQDEARELRSQVDLEIGGSITNTVLYAAGNVRVRGDLTNVTLSCRGDLSLDGEIIDCRQPGLDVGGNISCSGIKSSRVLCRGSMEFQDRITASEVVADGGVNSATGSLCGGHLESGGSVELRDLGDPGWWGDRRGDRHRALSQGAADADDAGYDPAEGRSGAELGSDRGTEPAHQGLRGRIRQAAEQIYKPHGRGQTGPARAGRAVSAGAGAGAETRVSYPGQENRPGDLGKRLKD